MKPRVLLDIAPLGFAQRKKSYARGLHRVALETVLGLQRAGECELHFVATSSVHSARDWLMQNGIAAEKLRCDGRQLWLSRLAEQASSWIERTIADRRWHLRATRWFLQRLAQYADALSGRISARALSGIDIYHSTLAPIPSAVRARKEIVKFLTVVDVIPLTNPTSVGGKGVPLLRQQLHSLTAPAFAFSISETVKKDLLGVCSLPSADIFVTPLAASPEAFFPIARRSQIELTLDAYSIPRAPYFLTLSSFDPRKNFEHVIRCFGRMVGAGELTGCNLVIVGSNPERHPQVARALAEVPALRDRIIAPGFIPDRDLAAIYSGAVAFLFPSLSEGFGIPVLEAMQCGLPVVSSDTTAMPEVVGNAGILLSPTDVDSWCDAMRKLWEDQDYRDSLAKRGRERSAEFSWENFTKATLRGYHVALGK